MDDEKEVVAPEDLEDDEAVALDPDLLIGDTDAELDDEVVDPFKDRFEE